ncbi:hypothetical protein CEXT_602401 [Caerostris extrusa]|uniref:Uncharacterized protein n=1 Tax=Caerostris extrusa TaxID=172846 RepID=A0AAV4XJJ3_CAEEX|nr:hypothetical protein CEXT_602401 [Caerostris extrusa]
MNEMFGETRGIPIHFQNASTREQGFSPREISTAGEVFMSKQTTPKSMRIAVGLIREVFGSDGNFCGDTKGNNGQLFKGHRFQPDSRRFS